MGFRRSISEAAHAPSPGADPWFQLHPVVAIWVALSLFGLVTALRFSVAGMRDPVTELYSLPIALLAIAFGKRAGIAAGSAAVVLIATWVAVADIPMTPLGWGTRAIPLLLLGTLVGIATDRLRAAQEAQRRMAAVSALQREAAEVNDSVVQGLAVAKWLLESDEIDRGLEVVTETMVTAQKLVSAMLGPDSPLPGDLRRSRPVSLA